MRKIIGITSNGPNLSDLISEHFGHCNYFVGIEIDENNSYKLAFSLRNNGHSSCMEPVMNMKNNRVSEMIVGGIGGRPYIGFLQMGIRLYQGVIGKTLEENIKLYLEGKLTQLGGPSCGEHSPRMHSF
ncbi:MAG: NifB/NifX family molybdenum-iron cluster-binding protein [Promethearchaeota archaeon]